MVIILILNPPSTAVRRYLEDMMGMPYLYRSSSDGRWSGYERHSTQLICGWGDVTSLVYLSSCNFESRIVITNHNADHSYLLFWQMNHTSLLVSRGMSTGCMRENSWISWAGMKFMRQWSRYGSLAAKIWVIISASWTSRPVIVRFPACPWVLGFGKGSAIGICRISGLLLICSLSEGSCANLSSPKTCRCLPLKQN